MFKRNSECQRTKQKLSTYIDGQLSPLETRRLESHLEGCESCRGELNSLREVVYLLRHMPSVAVPRSFTVSEAAPARRFFPLGALRAATAVAVLFLAVLFAGDVSGFFTRSAVEDQVLERGCTTLPAPSGEDVTSEPAFTLNETFATPDSEGSAVSAGLEGDNVETDGSGWMVSLVRQVELGLVGVIVVLGGATVVLWRRAGRSEAVKEEP